MSRYRYVSAMKAEGFPVVAACRVAEVSTSAYYDWVQRSAAPSAAEWDEALVVNEMYEIHAHLDDTYGSPRMTGELRRRGFCVNHKRAERLMAEHGIVARDGRRNKVRTTIRDVTAPPLPDLLRRDFSVGVPASGPAATSPTSRRERAGSTSPTCSTSAAGESSATRWRTTCAPSSSRQP